MIFIPFESLKETRKNIAKLYFSDYATSQKTHLKPQAKISTSTVAYICLQYRIGLINCILVISPANTNTGNMYVA